MAQRTNNTRPGNMGRHIPDWLSGNYRQTSYEEQEWLRREEKIRDLIYDEKEDSLNKV